MSGWGPVQVSSYTPWWDYWQHGWGSQQLDTYNPAHYLTPADRYRMAHPRNYVIPLATNVPKEPPYRRSLRTQEEIGRMGQDIGWPSLGTRGG